MVLMFQVDAFADGPFTGNPAAVVLLESEAAAEGMQALALENQLSETAFVWPAEDGFGLRWFTPASEVKLCGHATLATAHVLFNRGMQGSLRFLTKSGPLIVTQDDGLLSMDFPARDSVPAEAPEGMLEALGVSASAVLRNVDDYLVVVGSQAEVEAAKPEMTQLARTECRGVAVTAEADDNDAGLDFVSRFFAPRFGVPEDPVTGSAHCALAPYWAERLKRTQMKARQLSPRGGTVGLQVNADRVLLSGTAVTVFAADLDPVVAGRLLP